MQLFIDTALEAEMEEHLGYPKHEKADKPNKRNGHTKKTVHRFRDGLTQCFTSFNDSITTSQSKSSPGAFD